MARDVRLGTLAAGPTPPGPAPPAPPRRAPPNPPRRACRRTSGRCRPAALPRPGASATNYTIVAQKPPKSPQILATSVQLAEMPATPAHPPNPIGPHRFSKPRLFQNFRSLWKSSGDCAAQSFPPGRDTVTPKAHSRSRKYTTRAERSRHCS